MSTMQQTQHLALNPFRIRSGEGKGKLPHEGYDLDHFTGWLIEQGMTEDDYWTNLGAGDTFARKLSTHGKPTPTRKLTPDQRGWAKHDFPQHFGPKAKWFVLDPESPRKLIPAHFEVRRNRGISTECACGNPDYAEWGQFHDGRDLWQCENCGEVIIVNEDDGQEAA